MICDPTSLFLDMSRVEAVDSAGVALLLLMNERQGLTLEHCRKEICRMIKLCGYPDLCSGKCLQKTQTAIGYTLNHPSYR